ncbi:MAG: universal stress protein [Anaerolineae bacterium]|nr:universal stress protein [Anaerolineae bacterium]
MNDRVLLHVEGSWRGEWALALAALLQQHLEANITFLTGTASAPQLDMILQRAKARWGLSWEGLPRVAHPGTAEEVILTEARSHPYDLILLAPAGRRGLSLLLHGSRVGRVVTEASASVLVARAPLRAIRHILVTIAGNPHSEDDLAATIRFARAFRAHTTVLHVLSSMPLTFAGLPEREPALAEFLASDEVVARQMRDTHKTLAAEELAADLKVRVGLVMEEIAGEIAWRGYDLLVIGAHFPVGPRGDLTENLASRLIRRSPICTLVVRPSLR